MTTKTQYRAMTYTSVGLFNDSYMSMTRDGFRIHTFGRTDTGIVVVLWEKCE